MAVTVERLVADIEADPSGAVRGLKTFDSMVSVVSRDRTADLDVDSGGAMASIATLEAALARATRSRTVNVDTRGGTNALGGLSAVASGASGALGGVARSAGAAGGAMGAMASSAGGAGGAMSNVASSAGGAGGSMGRMASAIFGVGMALVGVAAQAGIFLSILSLLPGALMAVAAAAGALLAALAPLTGLLGAIPVGLGALGGGLAAVLAVALPVTRAFSAMDAAGRGAATQQANMAGRARELAAAQRGLREAIIGVARAERELVEARKNMAKAPMEAAEALEEQHFAAAGAILAEEQAVLSLRRAQQSLRDAQSAVGDANAKVIQQTDEFTGKVYDVAVTAEDASKRALDMAQSTLDVKQAELALQEARDDTEDQARKLREMEKKGIKNSEVMVQARYRLQDAEFGLARAHDAVAAAHDRIAEAQKRLNGSTADTTAAIRNLNEAMDKLSPTGQSFVRFLKNEFVPAFDGVSKAAQDAMLPGVERGLRAFMTMIDEMKVGLADFSKSIGDNFGDFFEMWAKPKNKQRLTEMFAGLNRVLDNVLKLALPLSDVLVSITTAATPMVNSLTNGLNRQLERLGKWMRGDEGKKKTQNFFNNTAEWTRKWGDLLRPIIGIFDSIVDAATPLANKIMRRLTTHFSDLNDELDTKKGKRGLTAYFNDAWPTISKLGEVITGLMDVLFNSAQGGKQGAFYELIDGLDRNMPKFKSMMENLDKSDAFKHITDGLGALADKIGKIDFEELNKDIQEFVDEVSEAWRTIKPIWDFIFGGFNKKDEDKNFFDKWKDKQSPLNKLKKFNEDVQRIKDSWNELSTAIKEEVAIWMDRWRRFEGWAKETWEGLKNDFVDKIEEFKTTISEEVAIWKDRWRRFKNWAKKKWEGLKNDFVDKIVAITTAIDEEIELWKGRFRTLKRWVKDNNPFGGIKVPDLDLTPWDGVKPPNPFKGGKWKGGSVSAGASYIVGEKGPELFNPTVSGRIMPANPTRELMESNGSGITDEQLEAILNRVLAKAKPNVDMEINNTEKVDPLHLSREIAWALA